MRMREGENIKKLRRKKVKGRKGFDSGDGGCFSNGQALELCWVWPMSTSMIVISNSSGGSLLTYEPVRQQQ
jgi:hypothetical protein